MTDETAFEVDQHRAFASGELPSFTRDKRYRRKDGSILWASLSVAALLRDEDNRPVNVLAIVQDASARKSLEDDLRRTRDLVELGLRNSNVSIFELDMPDGTLTTARQTMVNVWETLGHDAATAPTDFLSGAKLAVHPDDLAGVHSAMRRYLSGGAGELELEYRAMHKDGSFQWRLARGRALWGPGGKPLRLVGSMCDINEQKNVEARLRESEQRWRSLATCTRTFPRPCSGTRGDSGRC